MSDFSRWIGRTQETQDVITRSGVNRFYATVGDSSRARCEELGVAPLGYHWCICLPEVAMSGLASDGHPEKGGFLPPVPFPRRMWASSRFEYFADLKIGATVTRVSEVAGVVNKEGRSGPLVLVTVDHRTECDGELAIKERQTIVYRDASSRQMPLPPVTDEPPQNWQVIKEVLPSRPMLFRYSALTFNSHRIHYDLPYARDEEMYPELVVHGPLMATLCLQLASSHGSLKTFSFRGESAAFCDQPLYLVANFDDKTGELATLGADGRRCVGAQATFA